MTPDGDEPKGGEESKEQADANAPGSGRGPKLGRLTRDSAERLVAMLSGSGGSATAQAGAAAEDLVRRVQRNRLVVGELLQREVKRQMGSFGIATRDEVARLQRRVRALEDELAERNAGPRDPGRRAPVRRQPTDPAKPTEQ